MVRNICLTIEYDGTRFCGWQRQSRRTPGLKGANERFKTVQEEIEKALEKLFRCKIRLIGAGRTDSGVHAEGQVANFKVSSILPLRNIKRGLNSYLPKDIAVLSVRDASPSFHSRFNAKEKLYRYTIVNRDARSPLLKRYAAFISYDLDIKAMRKAARYFIGKKDFKSFQASDKKKKNSVRDLSKLDIVTKVPLIEIYIQANGFLYNMVRNIVGTLIDVGRGRVAPEAVKKILSKKHRPAAGGTAPAKGLSLVKVFYREGS
ncbi:tRNA pseudouridine(38-40) synthase TruA [Candidatus Omnitrophota bacterium]